MIFTAGILYFADPDDRRISSRWSAETLVDTVDTVDTVHRLGLKPPSCLLILRSLNALKLQKSVSTSWGRHNKRNLTFLGVIIAFLVLKVYVKVVGDKMQGCGCPRRERIRGSGDVAPHILIFGLDRDDRFPPRKNSGTH